MHRDITVGGRREAQKLMGGRLPPLAERFSLAVSLVPTSVWLVQSKLHPARKCGCCPGILTTLTGC